MCTSNHHPKILLPSTRENHEDVTALLVLVFIQWQDYAMKLANINVLVFEYFAKEI